jgi:hypothetical protein
MAMLLATDDGSGIAGTEYSLDNVTWNKYTSPFTIPQGNLNKVYYRTFDNAGNLAAGSSYIYFWPTSIPDLSEVIGHASSQAQQARDEVDSIVPIYRLLPPTSATAWPKTSQELNASGSEPADSTSDPVPAMIRFWKIVGGLMGFLT